jgi:hypothetical protein
MSECCGSILLLVGVQLLVVGVQISMGVQISSSWIPWVSGFPDFLQILLWVSNSSRFLVGVQILWFGDVQISMGVQISGFWIPWVSRFPDFLLWVSRFPMSVCCGCPLCLIDRGTSAWSGQDNVGADHT